MRGILGWVFACDEDSHALRLASKLADLQAANAYQRTCFAHARSNRNIHSIQTKKPPQIRGDFFVGWDGWIRTSENARVKVWCLTAWRHPNIWQLFRYRNIIAQVLRDVKRENDNFAKKLAEGERTKPIDQPVDRSRGCAV